MSDTTNVTLRMDRKLKEDAESLFSEFGMTMTTALTVFLRQSVRQGRIPFEISLAAPNAVTSAAIDDVKARKNLSRPFSSVEELFRDLNAHD